MGSHLRFGFEATYGRDTVVMRDDNVADYPWLCFALMTVMQEYARARPPTARDEDDTAPLRRRHPQRPVGGRARVRRPAALVAVAAARPTAASSARCSCSTATRWSRRSSATGRRRTRYSPLAFFFNFSHNVLKGMVVDALLRGRPWPLTFDDMLTALSRDEAEAALKQELAATLMGYARAQPRHDPRPADAGHRLRSGDRTRRVCCYDAQDPGMTYRFGIFEFDDRAAILTRSDRPVALEPQPARALALLLSRAGDVVTRDELRAHLWGDDTHVDFDRGLAYCVGQLRAALGDSADNPRFVQTLPRRGFCFIAPVTAADRRIVRRSTFGVRRSRFVVRRSTFVSSPDGAQPGDGER